jgi:hypothetical protein
MLEGHRKSILMPLRFIGDDWSWPYLLDATARDGRLCGVLIVGWHTPVGINEPLEEMVGCVDECAALLSRLLVKGHTIVELAKTLQPTRGDGHLEVDRTRVKCAGIAAGVVIGAAYAQWHLLPDELTAGRLP